MKSLIETVNVHTGDHPDDKIQRGIDLILRIGESNMLAITDLKESHDAAFTRIDTAMEISATAVARIATDLNSLINKVAELQVGGTLSPEDLAVLNEVKARAEAGATKAEAAASKLQELDAMTAPEAVA